MLTSLFYTANNTLKYQNIFNLLIDKLGVNNLIVVQFIDKCISVLVQCIIRKPLLM